MAKTQNGLSWSASLTMDLHLVLYRSGTSSTCSMPTDAESNQFYHQIFQKIVTPDCKIFASERTVPKLKEL